MHNLTFTSNINLIYNYTKTYRSLVDHRTRKAHRYVIRDRDLLKYLAGLVVFVTGYLAAWSALTAHLAAEGRSPLVRGRTQRGLPFTTCRSVWWEYVTETGRCVRVCATTVTNFLN